jgi:hypothetical protein
MNGGRYFVWALLLLLGEDVPVVLCFGKAYC